VKPSTQSEPRRIRVLEPAVAERIAAGEVIERPSSVVKELVENSLDAGATEIAVHLEDGGKALIEVTDNGHGIAPDDLPICIQRHATSKLNTLDDLERIVTLGFRGEALPSIGAVADFEILSRTRNEENAYALTIRSMIAEPRAQVMTFGHFLSSPHGTRVQARGLFAQVPARLKFLKAQNAEVAQVREWIERLALAHPEAGFRLVSDNRAILTLRPQEETARVRAILSDSGDYPMVTAVSEPGQKGAMKSGIQVRAHWLQGMSSPQTRRVVQVVNGRAIRDRMLQQAILSAFRQALLPGQFPAVAVFLDVSPAEIDVNVHPTKTEVRFLDNRRVFRAVENLISEMIEKNGAPAFVSGHSPFQATSEPTGSNSFRPWQARENFQPPAQSPLQFTSTPPLGTWNSQPSSPSETFTPTPSFGAPHGSPDSALDTVSTIPGSAAAALGLTPDRFMGTSFNTYLFYDLGTELTLIDQHAAHERIRYETLRHRALAVSDGRALPSSQALLIPEAVRFSMEERATLEGRLPWLEALGFEAEIFGEDTLLFRGIPGEWGAQELRVRLKNLVERVLAVELPNEAGEPADAVVKKLLVDENLFEKLASEACHSAIRAGDRLESLEALELVEQLFRCEHPWNCPHGRPTVVRIPKGRVEEWFQRRV
jgi:DNA mismatch repair protein MutL